MLFQVRMNVNIPLDMPSDQANEIKAIEKAYSQELQRQGKWRHIWRITGQYSTPVFLMLKAMKNCIAFYRDFHCIRTWKLK